MSTQNTKVPKSAFGNWRVMPHPDHKPSECIKTTMTPEELKLYLSGLENPKEDYLKAKMEDKNMAYKINITNEQLVEACRQYGAEASKKVAEIYNITVKQAIDLIQKRKIKEKLSESVPHSECPDSPSEDYRPRIEAELVKRRGLRPIRLVSQDNGLEYDFNSEYLKIYSDGTSLIDIAWEDLPNFIEDLTEIQKVANE